MFSQFIYLTPKNIKSYDKGAIKVEKKASYYEFELKGIRSHDAWLIRTEKSTNEEVVFRNYIWKGDYKGPKVEKVDYFYKNSQTHKLPPLPKFKVKREHIDRTFLYLDNPRPVSDGGYYYTVPLGKFIQASVGDQPKQ